MEKQPAGGEEERTEVNSSAEFGRDYAPRSRMHVFLR